VEAVAARNDVAAQLVPGAVVFETDDRLRGLELVERDVSDVEEEQRAAFEPRFDEVLDHLGLPVDDDRPPAGELAERDAVALAVELKLDAVVDDALALEPLSHARLPQQVDRSLLEHAGADAPLDVVAAAALEHDRLDALELEQSREREPGRPRADDRDLRPQRFDSSSSTCCAIAKAPLAAGTPQ
jgi:hypothetical protein